MVFSSQKGSTVYVTGGRDSRGEITFREKILLTGSCTNHERAVFVPLCKNKSREMLLLVDVVVVVVRLYYKPVIITTCYTTE